MEFLVKEKEKVLSAIQLFTCLTTSNFKNGAVCLLTPKKFDADRTASAFGKQSHYHANLEVILGKYYR